MNTQIIKQAQQLVADNSAALLTGTGVIGVVTTAVLTGKATLRAHEIVEAETVSRTVLLPPDAGDYNMDTLDKVKIVWPLFIPPVASGVTTISAIVFSYRISASKSAALAAAYGISEKAFSEYKEKVMAHVTPKKAEDIKDAVAEQKMKDNPPPSSNVMVIGDGEVLCLDSFSGQYFRSSMEKLRRAENDVNVEVQMHNAASLGDFYEKVGLKQTDISEAFIWTVGNVCELDFSTQLTDDSRPCLVVQFVNAPQPKFGDISPYV